MEDKDLAILIETEQRSKSNSHRIDMLETELRDVKNDQKAIYSIATSVEVIAQRVSHIEEKVDDTNQKVDAQAKAWNEAEKRLTAKVADVENKPYKKVSDNANTIKVAIVSAVLTALASGAVAAIISIVK